MFYFSFTGTNGNSGPETVTGFGNIFDVAPPATPTEPPPNVAPPSDAPIARLVIPAIDVDAPVTVKGVDANGVMENPDGPWDVAWYEFTARPGFGSNAVFSGHLDYAGVGPAVFWRLRELEQDDIVEVHLEDGTVYRYRVIAKDQVYAATADVGAIVGPTAQEIVTLITCAGTFDPVTGQYDQRLIIRAERIFDTSPTASGPATDAAAVAP